MNLVIPLLLLVMTGSAMVLRLLAKKAGQQLQETENPNHTAPGSPGILLMELSLVQGKKEEAEYERRLARVSAEKTEACRVCQARDDLSAGTSLCELLLVASIGQCLQTLRAKRLSGSDQSIQEENALRLCLRKASLLYQKLCLPSYPDAWIEKDLDEFGRQAQEDCLVPLLEQLQILAALRKKAFSTVSEQSAGLQQLYHLENPAVMLAGEERL